MKSSDFSFNDQLVFWYDEAGLSVPELCKMFRLHRSNVYRRLKDSGVNRPVGMRKGYLNGST